MRGKLRERHTVGSGDRKDGNVARLQMPYQGILFVFCFVEQVPIRNLKILEEMRRDDDAITCDNSHAS